MQLLYICSIILYLHVHLHWIFLKNDHIIRPHTQVNGTSDDKNDYKLIDKQNE